MSCLVDFLGESKGFDDARLVPVPHIGFYGFLMGAFQFRFVEFQGFFLCPFRRVGHIAFSRLLDSVHIADNSSTDEDFTEESTSFLVVQTIDGEDLTTFFRFGLAG